MQSTAVRVAAYCFNNAAAVIVAWVVLALVGLCLAVLTVRVSDSGKPVFQDNTAVVRATAKQKAEFPGLDGLAEIQITGETPAVAGAARDKVLAELRAAPQIFRQAFAPGSGDYYDAYAVYHVGVKALASRIDYSISIRPLLEVVARTRSLDGFAGLLEQIAVLPDLSKNANIYEDLLRKATASAEAARQGKTSRFDWIGFAGLDVVPESKSVVVLAWPNEGKEIESNELLDRLAEQGDTSAKIKIITAPPKRVAPKLETATNALRLAVVAAISLIMVVLILMILSGDLGFAAIVTACWLLSIFAALPVVALATPLETRLLPFYLAAGVFALVNIAHACAAMCYAIATAQRTTEYLARYTLFELPRRVNTALLFVAGLLGCFAYASNGLGMAAVCSVAVVFVSVLACCVLVPALFRYTAPDFHLRVLRRADLRAPQTNFLFAIALVASGCLFYLMPALRSTDQPIETPAKSISVLAPDATSAADAAEVIKGLKAVGGVRWLGDFLPTNTQEKHLLLQQLDVTLPQAAKAIEGDRLPALQRAVAALTAIASAELATPEMRSAASKLAASIQGISAQPDALAIENHLFAGIPELQERIKTLSALQPPKLADLDPLLRRMFLAQDGTYRIEVEPAEGVTPNGLAFALHANGVTVASPYMVAVERYASVLRAAFVVFGISLLGAMPLLFVARRRAVAAVQSICAVLFVLVAAIFALVTARIAIHEQLLLLAVPLLALLWTHVGNASIASRLGLSPYRGLSQMYELEWLLPLLLVSVALAAAMVNFFSPAMHIAFAAAMTLLANTLMELLAVNRFANRR
jgi:uncharacterized protein